ncbi:RES family NAD+ phosphorylase [Croceicoccus marinus]|uniref:RES family NAD+ phosphorylase n=1 Tax=Croceicoccus marinus TaxID=450378 RepID=A0A7G6VYN5_9SPHN|nr:RES family NAD+ phosphorylase [Croceicoccus marinus]QNE06850.1 RES family NAD+ phosphorylase [Croceicoccus marinus]
MRYKGLLYRALNPAYARSPLSGIGAQKYGGRFNRPGRETLYTSLAPDTALREANQVGTLQPTTLVALRADVGPIADGREPAFLAKHGFTEAMIADPAWRARMNSGEPVPTQELAETLFADGFAGILVPSLARGASAEAANLVLWTWDGMLELVDDDDRLGMMKH